MIVHQQRRCLSQGGGGQPPWQPTLQLSARPLVRLQERRPLPREWRSGGIQYYPFARRRNLKTALLGRAPKALQSLQAAAAVLVVHANRCGSGLPRDAPWTARWGWEAAVRSQLSLSSRQCPLQARRPAAAAADYWIKTQTFRSTKNLAASRCSGVSCFGLINPRGSHSLKHPCRHLLTLVPEHRKKEPEKGRLTHRWGRRRKQLPLTMVVRRHQVRNHVRVHALVPHRSGRGRRFPHRRSSSDGVVVRRRPHRRPQTLQPL